MSEQVETPVNVQDVEQEVSQTQALAIRESAVIRSLATGEDATRLIEQRMRNLVQLRRAAFKLTSPSDWVLFRDSSGSEYAMLAGDSREVVSDMLGISTSLARPVDELGNFAPAVVELPDGHKGIRAWCDAKCGLHNRELFNLEATIWDDEDFTGRKGGRDHRLALMTRLRAKAVRTFAGASRVPVSELADIFGDETWKLKARQGHGYGTSSDRRAASVAEGGLDEAKEKLRTEILRFAAGDADEAKTVLKRITGWKAYTKTDGTKVAANAGYESVQRMTQKWQIDKAFGKLRADPDYKAWLESNPEPAATESGREPGEE